MVTPDHIVDFHSHVLPRADHGSDSLETSLFQMKLAERAGVTRIIATPHFYPTIHNVNAFLKNREEAFSALLAAGKEIPDVVLGAEVLLCEGLDRLSRLDELCIFGTKNLLLELPHSGYSAEYESTVINLMNSGYDVILAHADRYSQDVIERILRLGIKVQLNAESVIGFKKLRNKHLFDWISRDVVVALGSDIHGRDSRAYSRLCKAYSVAEKLSSVVKNESMRIFEESFHAQYEKHKA